MFEQQDDKTLFHLDSKNVMQNLSRDMSFQQYGFCNQQRLRSACA